MNAAYNMIRKVFPEAFADGIEGAGLHPIRMSFDSILTKGFQEGLTNFVPKPT